MLPARVLLLTGLAMLAFAGNSLLCRLALRDTQLDAASFTSLRLLAGAAVLCLLVSLRQGWSRAGSWAGATALFVYAGGFSFAYLQLSAGTGALLLFGAVQLSMLLFGWWRGERLRPLQTAGLLLAVTGLGALLLPGASAPPLLAALLMLLAGAAWGAYSLLGRGISAPLAATADNFLRACPLGVALSLLMLPRLHWDAPGGLYAVLSGALTSGIGYAIWYSALPGLTAMQAASVQLSVPLLAALGGSLLLGEAISLRLLISSAAILGGIALVLRERRSA